MEIEKYWMNYPSRYISLSLKDTHDYLLKTSKKSNISQFIGLSLLHLHCFYMYSFNRHFYLKQLKNEKHYKQFIIRECDLCEKKIIAQYLLKIH